MESVYKISSSAISAGQQSIWLEFLKALIDTVEKLGNVQPAYVAFENDVVEPIVVHFSRFINLKMQPLIVLLSLSTLNGS